PDLHPHPAPTPGRSPTDGPSPYSGPGNPPTRATAGLGADTCPRAAPDPARSVPAARRGPGPARAANAPARRHSTCPGPPSGSPGGPGRSARSSWRNRAGSRGGRLAVRMLADGAERVHDPTGDAADRAEQVPVQLEQALA